MISSVNLPNIETIGDYAFLNNKSLAQINMDSVRSIGSYAFATTEKNSSNLLATLELPNVEYIGSYAFDGASSLKTVSLGESVIAIDSYAFASCESLTSVSFTFADTGESVEFFIIEQTRINGVNYLLVADSMDEEAEA